MKLNQISHCIFVCVLLLLVLNGCTLKGKSKSLKVAVRMDVPGFGFKNANDDYYYGFEIDVAKALAESMPGYNGVELYGADARNREELLSSGKVDCVIACYEKTSERAEKFSFSAPYYYDSLYLLVEKSLLFDELSADETVSIGVASGTDAKDKLLTSEFLNFPKNFKIVEFQTYQNGIKMLETGNVDAIFSDGGILHQFKSKDRQMVKLESETSDVVYRIATQKDSSLAQHIDTALKSLIEFGKIEEIRANWFDHS